MWSHSTARTEAGKPINKYLEEILQVLQDMINYENKTSETRNDASQLYNRILNYDFLNLLGFWNKVFIRIHPVQNRLHNPSMNFYDADLDLKDLQYDFDDKREMLFSETLEERLGLLLLKGVGDERNEWQMRTREILA